MSKVCVIGIAGGSGSGKSTLARHLKQRFGDRLCVLAFDNYYKSFDALPFDERKRLNFDCPDAFDMELLLSHVDALKAGQSVKVPVYDFTTHTRTPKTQTVAPAPIVLVEGILALADERLCERMDVRVFVDTDADVRILRRVRRDVRDRGRTVDSVMRQYLETVKPMYDRYVAPSRKNAHIVFPEGGKNEKATELMAAFIEKQLENA